MRRQCYDGAGNMLKKVKLSGPLMQSLEVSLQERQLDVGCALANVSVVKNSLEVFKNEVVSKHNV